MSYTLDNITEWTADLSTKHPIVQYRVYCLLTSDRLRREHEKEIIEACGVEDRIGSKEVTTITDELAVVCYTDNKNRVYYIPYAAGKKSFEWFPNFESALLAAVSLQQTNDTAAVKYAAKILEVSL